MTSKAPLVYIKKDGKTEISVNPDQPGVKEYVKTLGWKLKKKEAVAPETQSLLSDPREG